MKQKIPLLYLITYQKLKDKSRGGIIPRKKFSEMLTRLNHVTKRYVPLVLKEFKGMKLIEPINRSEIKILKFKTTLEL